MNKELNLIKDIINRSYVATKELAIANMEEIRKCQFKTETVLPYIIQAQQIIETFNKNSKTVGNIGCKSKEKPITHQINKKISQVDIEASEAGNVTFNNKDEVELANRQKQELEKLFLGFDNMEESELLELQTKVKIFVTAGSNEYKQKIARRLVKFNIKKRTVDEIVHDTYKEAEKAKDEQLKLNINGYKIESLQKTELIEVIKKIENEGSSTKLSKTYYDKAKKILDEINSGYISVLTSIPFNMISNMILISMLTQIATMASLAIVLLASIIAWFVYLIELVACAISWNKFKEIQRFKVMFNKEKIRKYRLITSIGGVHF